MQQCPYCFKQLPENGKCSCQYEKSPYFGNAMVLRPGTVVGGCYRIGAVLGKGGFGITYHGFDINAHRDVAIKEFFPKGMAERAGQTNRSGKSSSRVVAIQTDNIKVYQKSLKMFYKEAQTLYKLSGIPNVPTVYRIFQENGTAYIVMEYIEGKSLNQLLKENGAFPEEELLPLLDPVLEALEKVHALGIVHRDIAPDNIVINGSGQAVLLDFGASRGDIGQDGDSGTSVSSSLIVQKNGFSPPEQLSGETEPRSDIYALGATYYTLLSGSVPQASSNRAGRDRVRPLKELRISSGVSEAVMKAMSLRIDDRWSDVAEFREALNSAYLDPRDRKYYYAKGLMTSGHFEQALEILNEIPGWKNADEMISECGEKISSQEPEPDSGTEQKTTTYVKPAPVRETAYVQKTKPRIKMIIFGAVLAAAVIFMILYPGKGSSTKKTETVMPAAEMPASEITPASEKPVITETAAVISQAKILYTGDIITFGRYEQDEYNGADPIEWQVLAVENGRALVISRYVLAAKAYNDTLSRITWENCTLRKWLNEDFYNIAFSSREREKIKEVLNSNPGSDNVEGGDDTQDSIFLLSSREAVRYFKNNDSRRCPASYRAVQNGVNVSSGYAWWWLRSPGTTVGKAADVISSGYVGLDGSDIRFISLGVRPALWLDFSDPSVFEIIVSNKPQPLSEKKSLKAGDSFTFGQYEQDNDPDNGMEAIEWQVLAVENGRALVISQYGLDTKQYNDENIPVTWETSALRIWLNGEFYYKAFSNMENNRILQVTNPNPDNAAYGTEGGNETKDRIFLLSIDEAEMYFRSDEERICKTTAYALSNGAYVYDEAGVSRWWLRSPGYDAYSAARIDADGGVFYNGSRVNSYADAVRPAFWLDLNQ